MSTETATITGAKRDVRQSTGEGFIEVEVTFIQGKTTEVCKYAYPLDTTPAAIQKDVKAKLATRKNDRDHAEAVQAEAETAAEVTAAEKKADKTVAALEGKKVK